VLHQCTDKLYHFLLHNTTSLMQGDVLAPILFSLALLPALESTRHELQQALKTPLVDYFALIDDVVWVLPPVPNAVALAEETLAKHLRSQGLQIAPRKTQILIPSAMRSAADAEWIDILGTPFQVSKLSAAGLESARAFVREKILHGSRGQRHAEKLRALSAPHWRKFSHVALQLIRKVIIPSVTYQVRNTHPTITLPALVELDGLVMETVQHIFGELSDIQQRIIRLPLRMGGRGVTSTAFTAKSSYDAARSRHGASSRDLTAKTYEGEFRSIVEELTRRVYDETAPLKKVQFRRQLHRLQKFDPRASTNNSSSRFLEHASYISGEAYRDHVLSELGAMPLAQLQSMQCQMCGKDIPAHQRDTHAFSCQVLSKVYRHDVVRDTVAQIARGAAPKVSQVVVEPVVKLRADAHQICLQTTGEPAPAERRADIRFVHPRPAKEGGGEITVHLDVTIASEVTPDTPGAFIPDVIHQALHRKMQKYSVLHAIAADPLFVKHLVFASDCTMLRETEAFLRWLIEAKQVAAHGFANAVTTSRMLGDILATIVEAQYALKRRMRPATLAAETTANTTASEAGQSRPLATDARVVRISPLVGAAARAERL